jgi:hypothetical protein
LADVVTLLQSASKSFAQKPDVLEGNLRKRLEIFRWESIHRCGNMFRYPKEIAALDAVRGALGTTRRFEEVHAMLDRLESLVEDVSTVSRAYAERATNRLLLFLALFGLLTMPRGLKDLSDTWSGAGGALFVSGTLLLGLLLGAIYLARKRDWMRVWRWRR